MEKARENGWLIQKWGEGLGLKIRVVDDIKKPGTDQKDSVR